MAFVDHALRHVPDNPMAKAAVLAGFLPAVAHELVYIVLGLPMAFYYGLLAWREFRRGNQDGERPPSVPRHFGERPADEKRD